MQDSSIPGLEGAAGQMRSLCVHACLETMPIETTETTGQVKKHIGACPCQIMESTGSAAACSSGTPADSFDGIIFSRRARFVSRSRFVSK